MMLAALQPLGVRAYALACIPLAVACYFIVSTPIGGAADHVAARSCARRW